MAKAYWITAYRSVRDPQALAAYAKLALPALQAAGGRFLVRGMPARVYEAGLEERTGPGEDLIGRHARRARRPAFADAPPGLKDDGSRSSSRGAD
jgi:hypothetical protein